MKLRDFFIVTGIGVPAGLTVALGGTLPEARFSAAQSTVSTEGLQESHAFSASDPATDLQRTPVVMPAEQPINVELPQQGTLVASGAQGRMAAGGPMSSMILPGAGGGMVVGGPLSGTILPGAQGGMVIGGPLSGTMLPGAQGGMVIGGPLSGTTLPGPEGGMVLGGPLNGTMLPGAKGGMVVGGPLNGTMLPVE